MTTGPANPRCFFTCFSKDRSYPKPFVLADPRLTEILDLCNRIMSEIRSQSVVWPGIIYTTFPSDWYRSNGNCATRMGLNGSFRTNSRRFGDGNFKSWSSKTEATVRRALSTAYYTLFHLLIESACNNWPEPQRSNIARQFDHRRMKEVSENSRTNAFRAPDLFIVTDTVCSLCRKYGMSPITIFRSEFSVFDVGRARCASVAFESLGTDQDTARGSGLSIFVALQRQKRLIQEPADAPAFL